MSDAKGGPWRCETCGNPVAHRDFCPHCLADREVEAREASRFFDLADPTEHEQGEKK